MINDQCKYSFVLVTGESQSMMNSISVIDMVNLIINSSIERNNELYCTLHREKVISFIIMISYT